VDSSPACRDRSAEVFALKSEVLKGFGGDGEAVAAKPVGDGGAKPPSGRMRATGARPAVLASCRRTWQLADRNEGKERSGRAAGVLVPFPPALERSDRP
jgi:hypothetical protein